MVGLLALRGVVTLVSKRPHNLGIHDGWLAPCPAQRNCVSTQAMDATHRIEPIPFRTSGPKAHSRILEIVSRLPRAQLIEEEADYIHAEFRTWGLHHTDDVEFYFDVTDQLIHVRSAARLPFYDFGVNRNRVELIRSLYLAQ
ncbi:MAG: DUF1499 domain-containing protein [Chloroflexi bacterium]|nr:DUF1499 domain-containing protein [Chloroflexota bacterium]